MSAGNRLDAVLRAALDHVPGVVALATTAEGTTYEGAAGTGDVVTGRPIGPDTIFGLASMTKALVSAGAMLLVEQGRLSLDGKLADVLPELANPLVLEGFGDDGRPVLRPAARPITLRHVLSHSAGYGYNTWNSELGRYFELTGLPRVPTSSDELARTPLLFDPGTRWNYGINTDVAGKAVEAASGQRLDHFLREALLAPLGMADTTVELTEAQRARMTRTHQRGADGSLAPLDGRFGNGPAWCMGGGALLGTGRDYIRFVRMILNGGRHEGQALLAPESIAEMSRSSLAPGVRVTTMRTAQPAVSNDAEFFPGLPKSWSTAFMINDAPAPTGRKAGSLAWAGIANTFFWIDPASGVGGVFLSQVMPFADPAALAAFAAFEAAVYETVA
jgi:CubicO group peptidase (beta-lactamase class C family)